MKKPNALTPAEVAQVNEVMDDAIIGLLAIRSGYDSQVMAQAILSFVESLSFEKSFEDDNEEEEGA